MKESFLQNDYIDSHLLSCRYATTPVQEFYMREPYNYSREKSTEVTRSHMQKGNSGGHFYCYDGHIRKFVSIILIDIGFFEAGFMLKSILLPHPSRQDEIAFSLSRNAVNELSVPVTFVATLLRCYDYDEASNADRRKKNQKLLSASEVAKNMVLSARSVLTVADERAVSKMGETRRQVLGVSRKLPSCVIDYFRVLISQNTKDLQVAFTMATLKAIPKKVLPQECLALMKRIAKYYETCLPVPNPLHAKSVPYQLVTIRIAVNEIDKFKKLCEYDEIPEELNTMTERMLTTQIMDDDLADNATREVLFSPLVKACENLVTGGSQRLAIAERKISEHLDEAEEYICLQQNTKQGKEHRTEMELEDPSNSSSVITPISDPDHGDNQAGTAGNVDSEVESANVWLSLPTTSGPSRNSDITCEKIHWVRILMIQRYKVWMILQVLCCRWDGVL